MNSFLGNWETVFVFFVYCLGDAEKDKGETSTFTLGEAFCQVEHPGWLGVDEGGSATGSGDASFEI